jgi:hypothetical protein
VGIALDKIKQTGNWQPEKLWQAWFLTQVYENKEKTPIERWEKKDWKSLIPAYRKMSESTHNKRHLKSLIKAAHEEKHGEGKFPGDIDQEAKELETFYQKMFFESLEIANETVKEGISLLEQPENFRKGQYDKYYFEAEKLMSHRRMTKVDPDPCGLGVPQRDIIEVDEGLLNSPSQEIVTKAGRVITKNEFNYTDPNRKLPYANINTTDGKIKSILQINPELNAITDNSLGITDEALDKVLEDVKTGFDDDGMGHDVVMRVLLTIWVEKQRGSEPTIVEISLDEICEKLDLKKRGGEHTFEARQRMRVRQQVERVCKLDFKVAKVPDKYRNDPKYKWDIIDRVQNPFFDINARYSPEQQSLVGDDSQTWERIALIPGLFMVNLLKIYNRMFMQIPASLYSRLKPSQKAVRHLGWYLVHQFKYKARRQGKKQYEFMVNTLLDEAMIPLNPKAFEKLDKALGTLCSKQLDTIKGYSFEQTLDGMKKKAKVERITKFILRKWSESKITIEVPDRIFEKYERLSYKKDDELGLM